MTLTELYKNITVYQQQALNTHDIQMIDTIAFNMGYYMFKGGKKELKGGTPRQDVIMAVVKFYFDMTRVKTFNKKYFALTIDTITRGFITCCRSLGMDGMVKTRQDNAIAVDFLATTSTGGKLSLRLGMQQNDFDRFVRMLVINLCTLVLDSKGVYGYSVEKLSHELDLLESY